LIYLTKLSEIIKNILSIKDTKRKKNKELLSIAIAYIVTRNTGIVLWQLNYLQLLNIIISIWIVQSY